MIDLKPNATCHNPFCLRRFVSGKKGALKDYCARCYRYMQRHDGDLPGAKVELAPTRTISVVIPEELAQRVLKLADCPLATWVRRAAEKEGAGLK